VKHFTSREIESALAHSAVGGQALHTHRLVPAGKKLPGCFRRSLDAGLDIAHLFDMDTERLRRTARKLGIMFYVVEREGTPTQHIDLCASPLRKALAQCEKDHEP
jgi:hypothetical protein